MTPAARVQAAIELLDEIIAAARDNGPAADTLIARWFKARRYAGSKDRAVIRELVYRAIRAFGEPPESGRAAILGLGDCDKLFDGSPYGPAAIAVGEARAVPALLPKWLTGLIPADEHAALLERAPLDLRVNALKADRDSVLAELQHGQRIDGLPNGARLIDPVQLEKHQLSLEGKIEIQDAGSQLIVAACKAEPGMTIIDLCAGAGGKTLALAADMQGQGRLIACDTDRGRLSRLAPRAERAGATCETRLLNPARECEALADLEGQADIVLVDAPCSGSGTLRRNPEARWRLSPRSLERVSTLQSHILSVAVQLVKPGGVLVYAVCSLLDREGPEQIDDFLARNDCWVAHPLDLPIGRVHGHGWRLTPSRDATDGFFLARLARDC